jgi:hypothetical protein
MGKEHKAERKAYREYLREWEADIKNTPDSPLKEFREKQLKEFKRNRGRIEVSMDGFEGG